jgi:hypothetical protein
MPYTANPVWMFPPNWEQGVLERLEFKTDVMTSEVGYEQRVSRRLTPRRFFEATFLIPNRDRQYFEMLMAREAAHPFLIPLWHQVTQLTAAAASGQDTLTFDTVNREYKVGDLVILRGRHAQEFEVGEVEAVTATTLTLISNLENSWRKGTFVYPARLARIMEAKLSAGKKTDRAISVSMAFRVDEVNPYSSADLDFTTYLGTPVLELRPDDSEELQTSYSRNLSVLDNDLALPDIYDFAGLSFTSQGYRWGVRGRTKHDELRRTLYALRGRANAMWVPTFMDDMTLATDIAAEDTTITISNIGYSRLEGIVDGRKDIVIELFDGTRLYRRITSAVEDDADTETLTFAEPFVAGITIAEVFRISYIARCRLEQDLVELNHLTDTDGVTTCAISWAGPLMYEENANVTFPALPDPGEVDCPVPPCDVGFTLLSDFEGGGYTYYSVPGWNQTDATGLVFADYASNGSFSNCVAKGVENPGLAGNFAIEFEMNIAGVFGTALVAFGRMQVDATNFSGSANQYIVWVFRYQDGGFGPQMNFTMGAPDGTAASSINAPFDPSEGWNKFRVERIGSTLTMYVNDVLGNTLEGAYTGVLDTVEGHARVPLTVNGPYQTFSPLPALWGQNDTNSYRNLRIYSGNNC